MGAAPQYTPSTGMTPPTYGDGTGLYVKPLVSIAPTPSMKRNLSGEPTPAAAAKARKKSRSNIGAPQHTPFNMTALHLFAMTAPQGGARFGAPSPQAQDAAFAMTAPQVGVPFGASSSQAQGAASAMTAPQSPIDWASLPYPAIGYSPAGMGYPAGV